MPKFIPYNYNQTSMVVINYKDQLQPGTFEHAVHFLIDTKLDLSIFYPKFKNNEIVSFKNKASEDIYNGVSSGKLEKPVLKHYGV